MMFKGAPIASCSKKLAHVGLSAMQNEYMALRFAASTVVWFSNLMKEIGCSHYVSKPIMIYGDNTVANMTAREDFVSSGNQHIYVPYHFVKEVHKKGIIDVQHVPGKENISDIFTKPVTRQVIDALLNKMKGYDHTWQTTLT